MIPRDLISTEEPNKILQDVLFKIHNEGPIQSGDLEKLSYIKYFHPNVFEVEEPRIMYLLGLFYKVSEPQDLLSLSYSIFSNSINSCAAI